MITREDRAEFSHYTDESILGIKMIRGLRNSVLMALAEERKELTQSQRPKLKAILELMGEKTSTSWVFARVADELMDRDIITEDQHTEMCR